MRKIRLLDKMVFIFIALICGYIFINIANLMIKSDIELFSIDSPLIFALIVGFSIFILLIITVLKELKNSKEYDKQGREESKEIFGEIKIAVIFILIIIVYTVLLRKLGFVLCSVIFMILGMTVLNSDDIKLINKIIKASTVSLIAVPVLYFIFHEVFHVMLP